ncbi:MAG TPA: hypothetical protein VI072_11625 [Polyangiaceae bacterium]
MVLQKTLIAILVLAGAASAASSALANRPRDDFFNRQPPGARLKLFPFFGPGFRGILEHRLPIEPDMSELQTQIIGDVNPGFAESSLNLDARFFLVSFGASIGVRRDYHILKFEPDENGLDHGERELNRHARWLKDNDQDWRRHTWPWYEGRLRVLAPLEGFMGVSTLHVRYQDRSYDNGYDWPLATVFDEGLYGMVETFFVARDKDWGFAGLAGRVLYVPRGDDHEVDVHYGVLAGTQVGAGNRDLILLRFYTTLGHKDDLMGTHAFHAPIQIVLGYQADFELW